MYLVMRKIIVGTIILSLLLCFGEQASAQFNRKSIKKTNKRMASFKGRKTTFKNKAYTAVGVSLSALNYYGDIAPRPQRVSTDISFTKPAISLSLMHRFGPRYTFLGSFMFGTLKGSDAETAKATDLESGKYRYQRNLSFRNQIKELSAVAYFDLFDNTQTYISRVQWTPFVFIGAAAYLHNPQAEAPAALGGGWVDLQPLGTEGQFSTLQPTDANFGITPYKKFQIAIPFGVGARFKVNEVMDLWGEIGFRYTFTDYLDDVSQNYVDLGVFTGGNAAMAKAMSYRGGELSPQPATSSYVGRDGATYNVINGYGSEHPSNMRGSKSDRDVYMVTTIRLTYILGATLHKAKFR
jgi:Domain of unknown function (DUF6089)